MRCSISPTTYKKAKSVFFLVAITMVLMSSQASSSSLIASHPTQSDILKADFSRQRMTDWDVLVTGETIFIPGNGLPNPFSFYDLQVGQFVFIVGHIHYMERYMEAVEVYVDDDMKGIGRNGPAPMTDHLFGQIGDINYSEMRFHVWASSCQGDIMPIKLAPDAVILEAFQGEPLTEIPFEDLMPGDPVMLHGYMVTGNAEDYFWAEVVIRSDDWDYQTRDEGDDFEIYGFIDHIGVNPHGDRMMGVYVETFAGDPNHQTFETYIDENGGVFEFPWGHLAFPPGALTEGQVILVSGDFMFWWTLRNIYRFEPDMEFQLPVEIEIRYFNLDGINPSFVKLSYYDEEAGRWRIATHMTHYPEEHCFRGYITHFSRYSLSANSRPLEEWIQQ